MLHFPMVLAALTVVLIAAIWKWTMTIIMMALAVVATKVLGLVLLPLHVRTLATKRWKSRKVFCNS